jgi:hypothetical protein
MLGLAAEGVAGGGRFGVAENEEVGIAVDAAEGVVRFCSCTVAGTVAAAAVAAGHPTPHR